VAEPLDIPRALRRADMPCDPQRLHWISGDLLKASKAILAKGVPAEDGLQEKLSASQRVAGNGSGSIPVVAKRLKIYHPLAPPSLSQSPCDDPLQSAGIGRNKSKGRAEACKTGVGYAPEERIGAGVP
jgi:hypothetical protein